MNEHGGLRDPESSYASDRRGDIPYILVLGTADWNQLIATNQHYVVRELCHEGFATVDFVESLGLRRLEPSRRDLKRIAARLLRAISGRDSGVLAGSREKPANLRVISPLVVPFHGGRLARLNRHLLERRIVPWLRWDGPRVLWTYSPVTYGLERHAAKTIYHCVDLLGKVPGIDESVIELEERRLASLGVTAVASSGVVKAHLEAMGFRSVLLWENVADTDVFTAAGPAESKRVSGRVVFAGNLAPNKVDFSLLEGLADAGFEVRVAGPHAEGGGDDTLAFASLLEHGVTYLGMLSLAELANELVTATVGLIPYKINEYTHGVNPLKTFEYLAAGLAVVSTPVPAVEAVDGDVIVVESTESASWVQAVWMQSGVPSANEIKRRVARATEHSWSARGELVRGEAVN